MTESATAGVSYFVPDDREVHRDGWTYTADTLATFDPSEEIVLILGADAARGLATWERADEVLDRVGWRCCPGRERSGARSRPPSARHLARHAGVAGERDDDPAEDSRRAPASDSWFPTASTNTWSKTASTRAAAPANGLAALGGWPP